MSDATLSLVVLAGTVALFVWNRLPVGLVAVLSALAVYATGLVDAPTAVGGFGDPVVVFIAALFVIAAGLERSGVTAWAGRTLVQHAGTTWGRLLVAIMALTALLAAVVTPNGGAAAMLPVVVLAARRARLRPSALLMPTAYAASAGALLALSGSPVNVIVSDALYAETGRRFGFFEFALVGVPLVLVTTAVAALVGRRLLPERQPHEEAADLSDHLETILEHYRLDEGFTRAAVRAASPLVGASVDGLALTEGIALVGVQRADGEPGAAGDRLAPGDVLVVTGSSSRVGRLVAEHGLDVVATPVTRATRESLLSREAGVGEVVVPPRSALVGQKVFPGQVRRNGLTVLAVHRLGHDLGAQPADVEQGDMLLLHGPWDAVAGLAQDDDVLVVDDPALVRQQNAPLGPAAWRALGVLVVTVALFASGVTAPAVAALVGAAGMVLLRVLSEREVYRAVSWQTVVLIGGLIPLSVAIQTSGAADELARHLVALVGDGGTRVLFAAIFGLTVVLGQFVSNAATVLVVTPIALAAAHDAGVGAAPMLMLVAVAGAASFLTPIATPANMIVMGPGGYRFGDYWRLGIVTTAVWFVVAIGLIPLVWST
ncbi:SLC13 family permease [Cellulomonas alba]|uniref:SLC13 family permease n=1 Tax=Cellulomonas alba TaxID=3053467 RepID=A0ABT7SD92_9CELL|nr:SLC13 family permease [Cellulomonas alba]MDM7854153.1 SLC13 family permease [Cellulomonas alba]